LLNWRWLSFETWLPNTRSKRKYPAERGHCSAGLLITRSGRRRGSHARPISRTLECNGWLPVICEISVQLRTEVETTSRVSAGIVLTSGLSALYWAPPERDWLSAAWHAKQWSAGKHSLAPLQRHAIHRLMKSLMTSGARAGDRFVVFVVVKQNPHGDQCSGDQSKDKPRAVLKSLRLLDARCAEGWKRRLILRRRGGLNRLRGGHIGCGPGAHVRAHQGVRKQNDHQLARYR